MKFAKEIERDLVPEWRLKYLDYKLGKKKLKAIDRALRNVNQTPRLRRRGTNSLPGPSDVAPKYSFLNRDNLGREANDPADVPDPVNASQPSLQIRSNGSRAHLSQLARTPEEAPLTLGENGYNGLGTSYGSIIGSPPSGRDASSAKGQAPPSLQLPGAALDPDNASPHMTPAAASLRKHKSVRLPSPSNGNAFEVGKTRSPHKNHKSLPARYRSIFSPKRMNSMPGPGSSVEPHPRPFIKRVMSMGNQDIESSPGDVPLEAYRELDFRQAEFFQFLDQELEKVEQFYKEKEDESNNRLTVLRDQLHIMRDRRLDELIKRQTAKLKHKSTKKRDAPGIQVDGQAYSSNDENGQEYKLKGHQVNNSWLNPIDAALDAVSAGKYGNSTRAMTALATPSVLKPMLNPDDRRDFARRPELPEVPYQAAKRKLKVALQEYYRGLELLKSYALLNRTAFRKINKKYDKTVHARPSMRYMNDKVNKAWFVNSDVIEGHIRSVEDLYARYFEQGNHKVAVGKLRIKIARAGDYTDNTFRNGLLLSAGASLSIQGLIKAAGIADSYHPDDPDLAVNTSYLLQIYAGFFLANLLVLLFSLACRVWHNSKINFVFIFEYDTRHFLDWRQLAELPCWYFLFLGLTMQLNFHRVGGEAMYLYWPVILIGLSVLILFNPIRIFYYRSRMWLLYSLWRLLLAGIYPVEWRDFYLGDMFCSLTYTMSNMAMFFCLYARGWNEPAQCNSSHLRTMGFLSCLPGIWRALQCIRRYRDTGNKFPHLLNCGKYFATIIFYMALSIYRINKTGPNRAIFITFATINAIYTSFWDIYYDWSLGDPRAKHPFLRKELGYKKVWMYYVAMVIDPILRFNWVLYAVSPLQLQHSAKTSFVAALGEIFRRGMWSVFRVENEHCTNVSRFRASRDVPLPYEVPPSPELESRVTDERGDRVDEEQPARKRKSSQAANGLTPVPSATGAALERSGSTRQRRGFPQAEDDFRPSPLQRAFTHVGDIFRDAHAQDFERKKKPELGRDPRDDKMGDAESSDESDNEDAQGDNSGTVSGGEGDDSEKSDDEVADDVEESAISRIREDLSVGMGGSAGEGPSSR
ncbi:Xenotropic and polytropic retrovirus receptor 1 [Neodidymelliopsis sp. IMI 364377]|nr:Xenotropic and polytropic retrovirus receptor 1 [Neodidymelliopsis sp. IMI 364377]